MKITIRTMWAIDPQFPTNSPPTHTLTHTLPLDPIRAQDGVTVNFYAMWRNHRGRVVHIVRMVIFITDIGISRSTHCKPQGGRGRWVITSRLATLPTL